jgi:ATP-dependent helicase HrpB
MGGNGRPLDLMSLPDLPLRPRLAEAAALLSERGTMVLRAEPGSGKTTLLPLGILAGNGADGGTIVMLEPRRVAAVQAAARIAELLGERSGETAGYAVRGESSRGPMTKILCVTDGLFLRMVQGDPGLEGIGTVILDEFHERSVNADLALAFCLEARASLRTDLRIALMSATMDAESLSAWLSRAAGAETGLLSVPGAPFPVKISYAAVNPRGRNDEEIAQRVCETAAGAGGDVLVFLPGLREMEGVARALPVGAAAPEVILLHGSLPLEEQRRIVAGRAGGIKGRQRIILSTSLAQSSLTVPGVRAVVDAGLTRLTRYDPSSGMDALVTERVSRRDADQRAGRAGRLGPGTCLRLWGEADPLNESTSPEIQRIDLAPFLLECAVWGSAPEDLSLPDPPPKAALSRASDLLQRLELIDAKGRATEKGKACAALGAGPRLGSMLIARPNALSCACAALLSDRDRSGIRGDADIRHRLASLRDGEGVSRAWIDRMRQDFSRFADSCGLRGDARSLTDTGAAGDALALAFPDRVCKREGEAYRFPSGKTARLAAPSGTHAGTLQGEEWLVAVEADPGEGLGLIRAAAPLSQGFVEKMIVQRAEPELEIEWRGLSPRLRAQACFGKIRLTVSLPPPDGVKLRELVAASFSERLESKGLGILPWTDGARELLERARFFLGAREPGRAELLSQAGLESALGEWLIPRCAFPAAFKEGFYPPLVDEPGLRAALASRIAPFRAAMDREAPEHIVLPSGRSARIIYAAGAVPAIEGKVQEFFGLSAHPKAAGQPVAIRLLSPAQRPVQITRDIAGFWKNSYPEVRKELRGRYPKHEWPEDGAAALPSRGPKKKKPS